MKKQIENLKEEMSELVKISVEANTIELVILALTGWAICPLLAICGLFAKLYIYIKNRY